jgi:hypothetical protein
MRVEKELFTTLFRLAMEDVDMFSEIRNCMGRMPWREIDQIGNGPDSSWFKPEFRDSNRSHSIAASGAPGIQPLAPPPSTSFSRLSQPPSSSQHQMNLDSGASVPHTREVNSSTNIGSQTASPNPDAMDIDKEDPPTNPQVSSVKPGRMTLRKDKDVRGANIPLPQIQKLHLKGPGPKPSLKGKKRATVEDEDEEDEEDQAEDEDEDEEMEEEDEMVSSPTQTHS